MTTRIFTAYIVRETEKARAVLLTIQAGENSPLWVPVSKTVSLKETDAPGKPARIKGEKVSRVAIPCEIEIDAAFCEKVGL